MADKTPGAAAITLPSISCSTNTLGVSLSNYSPRVGNADVKLDAATNRRIKAVAKKRGI
jgi:hypothetical protein